MIAQTVVVDTDVRAHSIMHLNIILCKIKRLDPYQFKAGPLCANTQICKTELCKLSLTGQSFEQFIYYNKMNSAPYPKSKKF